MNAATTSPRMLRLPQVLEMVGCSRSHLQRLESEGGFPKRIPLGRRSVGWLASEVEAWIQAKADARRASA